MSSSKQIVFISCGQRTQEEKSLGSAIQDLVLELTSFQPYFAEYQNSFEGLSKHIFGALYQCVGFIAVMHHRGLVGPPIDLVRASVWVEQEIAIAAFIHETLGRKIHVAAYAQRGLAIEGLREQLILNPKEFAHSTEVLEHLRLILPTWKATLQPQKKGPLELAIDYKKVASTQERHDYQLMVRLANSGNQPVDRYHVDLEFPTALIENRSAYPNVVQDRCSHTHTFLRTNQASHRKSIFPGDTLVAMSLDYFVDTAVYHTMPELLKSTVRATLYLDGFNPLTVEKSMVELQVF